MMGLLDQMSYFPSAMSRNSIELSAKKGLSHRSLQCSMQGGSTLELIRISLARLLTFLEANLLLLGTDICSWRTLVKSIFSWNATICVVFIELLPF